MKLSKGCKDQGVATIKRVLLAAVISVYRAGIADGGEFYIRPPGTAAWLFDKVKY